MEVSIGIDIGGTKCALSVGECSSNAVKVLHREEFPTKGLRLRPRWGLDPMERKCR